MMLIGIDEEHIITLERVAIECVNEANSGITEKIYIENFKKLCDQFDIDLALFKSSNNRYCINSCFKQVLKLAMSQSAEEGCFVSELLQSDYYEFDQLCSIYSNLKMDYKHIESLDKFQTSMHAVFEKNKNDAIAAILYMLDKKFNISIKLHYDNIRNILNLINTTMCRSLRSTIEVMGILFEFLFNVSEKFAEDNVTTDEANPIRDSSDMLVNIANNNSSFYRDFFEGLSLTNKLDLIDDIHADPVDELDYFRDIYGVGKENWIGMKLPRSYREWNMDTMLDNLLFSLNNYDDYISCVDILKNVESTLFDFYQKELKKLAIDTNILNIDLKKPKLSGEQMKTARQISETILDIYKVLYYKMYERQIEGKDPAYKISVLFCQYAGERMKNSSLTLDEMLAYQKDAHNLIAYQDISDAGTVISKKNCQKTLKDIHIIKDEIATIKIIKKE